MPITFLSGPPRFVCEVDVVLTRRLGRTEAGLAANVTSGLTVERVRQGAPFACHQPLFVVDVFVQRDTVAVLKTFPFADRAVEPVPFEAVRYTDKGMHAPRPTGDDYLPHPVPADGRRSSPSKSMFRA